MKKINIYIWCSKKQLIPLVYHYVIQKKCNWNIINWCKTNPIPTCNNKYLTDVEYCLFFRDKGVKIGGSYESKRTYYVTPINQKDKKLWKHPTIKPEFITNNFIINSSNEKDIILDPFMGSGTTGACAKNLNRAFIGIEINKEYYDIAVDRINKQVNEQVSEQAKNDTEELEGQIKLTD